MTRATLGAVLKHPWTSAEAKGGVKKFGAYSSEADVFDRVVEPLEPAWRSVKPPARRPTAEAQIMDWADDLTYALHDAADYYRSGQIPLHTLADLPSTNAPGGPATSKLSREWSAFVDYLVVKLDSDPSWNDWNLEAIESADSSGRLLEDRFREVAAEGLMRLGEAVVITGPYDGTRVRRAQLTYTISSFMNSFVEGPTNDWERSSLPIWVDPETRLVSAPTLRRVEVQLLKGMLWAFVIRPDGNVGIEREQKREKEMLSDFLDYLEEELEARLSKSLPDVEKQYLGVTTVAEAFRKVTGIPVGSTDRQVLLRAVVDTVCSVTDQHVITWEEQRKSTSGISPDWLLELPW